MMANKLSLGFVGIAMALTLSACSSDSKDVYGNCTQDYLDHYNAVSSAQNAFKNISQAQLPSAVTKLTRACKAFFDKHSGQSCTASVNGKLTEIDSQDKKKDCQLAYRMYEMLSNPAPQDAGGGGNGGGASGGGSDVTNESRNSDIQSLIESGNSQLVITVANKRQLDQVTSSAWRYSEGYAVDGMAMSAQEAGKRKDRVRCHFVDKVKDFGDSVVASQYKVALVETYRRASVTGYSLHLTAPKDKASKFISCRSKEGSDKISLSELQGAFGSRLGLKITVRSK